MMGAARWRAVDSRNLRRSRALGCPVDLGPGRSHPALARAPDGRPQERAGTDVTATVSADGKNRAVDLGRIGWLATVLACLIAVLILVLQGYYGYAAVTLAVAVSAGINLT
jgi:hypothetical protein